MALWAAAIPAAASLIGGAFGRKSRRKQERLQKWHLQLQEQARKDAMAALNPESFQKAEQEFFPGLRGNTAPDWHTRGVQNAVTPQQPGTVLQPRAQGGPVQPGQNYLVGEGGPEVLQVNQPGNIVPNPATTPTPTPAAQPTPGASPPSPSTLPAGSPAGSGSASPTTGGVGEATTPVAPATGDPAQPTEPVAGGYISPRDALMAQMTNFLTNPGQVSTTQFERQQEMAESDRNTAIQNIVGGAAGSGIDPSSGGAQAMIASADLNASKLKSEAARDQGVMEEQLRREDIGMGSDLFMGMLQYMLNLQGQRAQAAGGQGFTPVSQLPSDNFGTNLAQVGKIFGDYLAQKGN